MNILDMGVFRLCFTSAEGSLEVMSQVIESRNVPTKEKRKKNQFDGLESNLKFCIVPHAFFLFYQRQCKSDR